MKNREKYREEIVNKAREMEDGNFCRFKKLHVLPQFYKDNPRGSCTGVGCVWCNVLLDIWLEEECKEGYEEPLKPEVDWSKVPVDTLVRVRDYEYCEWNLRYFKGVDKSNPEEKYEAWSNGATSKTANDSSNHWKYCELVEDEDE